MWNRRNLWLAALCLGVVCGPAPRASAQPKDAEPATRRANAEVLRSLRLSDRADFDDAQRGFIAAIPDGEVRGDAGRVVLSLNKSYGFEQQANAPATVNPSLWRQAQLNGFHGLFKVTDRVYQIRGLGDSNLTIVESDTGVIVIDTLIAVEMAKAGMDLYFQHRPRKPVIAVIYTHSHADHIGGARGVVSEDDVRAGKVAIIAPAHFIDYTVAESVITGNTVRRRAFYQFGLLLPPGERGHVDGGIGKTTPRGTFSFIVPTDSITGAYETRKIDGVEIEFHLVPGAEAPDEMILYFPQFKILDMAELTVHSMHNLLPMRGAEVRDARLWARYIGETLERYGDRTDIMIGQHQWPVWGRDHVGVYLRKQRDLYKFVHDQSVRLMNFGYTPDDLAASLRLPASLADNWATRGYYGTLSEGGRAVYQRYLGWYDANPAHLSSLPPVEQARKNVEYMGGADAIIKRARDDYTAGNYRWVASVMNQVVFADPRNRSARELGADALEQLGYQAESAAWRNAYLVGAMELRSGLPNLPPAPPPSPQALRAIPTGLLLDFLAVRLNPEKAEGKTLVLNWTFTDSGAIFIVNLENSALTYVPGKRAATADAGFTLTRAALDALILKQKSVRDLVAAGEIKTDGDPGRLEELLAMFDDFQLGFPIVEPKPGKS